MQFRTLAATAGAVLGALLAPGIAAAKSDSRLHRIDHIVVVYQENHSFDNLYGGWEGVTVSPTLTRLHGAGQSGRHPYACLKQNDPNLTTPALSATCHDATTTTAFDSHFGNAPFTIDDYIPATATTCTAERLVGAPGTRASLLPGAVPAQRRTAEPLHNGQRRDRPDPGRLRHEAAADLSVPAPGAPPALRGSATTSSRARSAASFLNHQWVIAAATPTTPAPTRAEPRGTCIPWSTATACRTRTPCTRRPGRSRMQP